MEALLLSYSLTDIAVFLVLLAIAVKEGISFIDWAHDRIKKWTDKDYKAKKDQEHLEEQVEGLEKFYAEKQRVDDGFEHLQNVDKQILEKLDAIERTLNEHIRIDDDRNADSIRAYILRFNMELVRDIKHTREDYIEVLTKIDEYESYCAAHAGYKNNRAVSAINNIKRTYEERLQKRDFV